MNMSEEFPCYISGYRVWFRRRHNLENLQRLMSLVAMPINIQLQRCASLTRGRPLMVSARAGAPTSMFKDAPKDLLAPKQLPTG